MQITISHWELAAIEHGIRAAMERGDLHKDTAAALIAKIARIEPDGTINISK